MVSKEHGHTYYSSTLVTDAASGHYLGLVVGLVPEATSPVTKVAVRHNKQASRAREGKKLTHKVYLTKIKVECIAKQKAHYTCTPTSRSQRGSEGPGNKAAAPLYRPLCSAERGVLTADRG